MGCARTDHPGCGSSWHTPRSPCEAPHTLLPPQGESWGPSSPGLKTRLAVLVLRAVPDWHRSQDTLTVSLEGWRCPEPYQSPALCPASPSACVMAYLSVSLHTHSHTTVLPGQTGSVGQQMWGYHGPDYSWQGR